MNKHWKILSVLAGSIAILIAIYLYFGIPIACGTHGCIRDIDFRKQHLYDVAFAHSTNSHEPSTQATLTTLMRRYLLTHISSAYSIPLGDAAKYRDDVLHITDSRIVNTLGFSSLQEYDQAVLVPFLTQEALMKERHTDTPAALYRQLAEEQLLILLKPGYTWEKQTGEVIAK
jgi:hypothetical protein